jgi:cullin-associated NEDD8-dissociated protein 1
MKKDHEETLTIVAIQLDSNKPALRKRAAICLASLAVVSSNALLYRLVDDLLLKIDSRKSSVGAVRSLIQTIGTISRTVGYRLGRHLDRIIPLFIHLCGDPTDESQQTEEYNDIREQSFPGLESFVLKCPLEVTPHVSSILDIALRFSRYDPNYCYDEEEEGNDEGTGDIMEEDVDQDEDDADMYQEEYEGSDDDDTSWKVRKAAVRVILAIITARKEVLEEDMFAMLSRELILRFKEREESVRLEVFNCFIQLLYGASHRYSIQSTTEQSIDFASMSMPSLTREHSSSGMHVTSNRIYGSATTSTTVTSTSNNSISNLKQYLKLSTIVKSCLGYLKSNSEKTKCTVFNMLRLLTEVLEV